MNLVILDGVLAKDPELKTLQNGTHLANIVIRNTAGFKDKVQTYDIACTAWNKNAEICQGLAEGQGVVIQGEIQKRKWEKDGQPRERTEISIRSIVPISIAYSTTEQPQPIGNEQDIPF